MTATTPKPTAPPADGGSQSKLLQSADPAAGGPAPTRGDRQTPPPQPTSTKAPHQRGWATQREAAALLGLNPDSVRKATRRGLLPCVTINSRLKVIYIDDIERYRRDHLGQHPGKSRQRPAT